MIADLEDDGKVERGWLGVQIQGVDEDLAANLELDEPPRARWSASVQPDSPAEAAGVKQGDVILSFDGKPIDQVRQLSRAVAVVEPGKQGRDRGLARRQGGQARRPRSADAGQEQVAAAEQAEPSADQPRWVWRWPPSTPEQRERLGLDADQGRADDRRSLPGGPAEAKGIQAGDLILSIDRKPVREPAEVVAAVRKAHESGAKSVLLYVVARGPRALRGGAARDVVSGTGGPGVPTAGAPGLACAAAPQGPISGVTGARCRCTC